MIVWKKHGPKMNDQRFRVLCFNSSGQVHLESCGTDQACTADLLELTGLEMAPGIQLFFDARGVSRTHER